MKKLNDIILQNLLINGIVQILKKIDENTTIEADSMLGLIQVYEG